jgi:hypothetical protein
MPENRHGNGTSFKPGQSGNPGGRKAAPKEFKELARKTAPAALKYVASVVNDEKAHTRDRIKAAELVMDRAWGRPTQPLTGEDGGPLVVVLEGDLSKWAK